MEKKLARTNLRGADGDVLQIVALQSREPNRIRLVLDLRNPIRASILPHVIPLLEDRAVAGSAMQALQLVADTYGGALVDALLDPSRTTVVRRRLARVLSVCRSQIVADGLLMAVEDPLPDIRTQSARSLFRIRSRHAEVRIDAERMLDLVRTELGRTAPDRVMSLRCYRLCCRFDRCARPTVACAVTTSMRAARRSNTCTACCRRTFELGCWGNGINPR